MWLRDISDGVAQTGRAAGCTEHCAVCTVECAIATSLAVAIPALAGAGCGPGAPNPAGAVGSGGQLFYRFRSVDDPPLGRAPSEPAEDGAEEHAQHGTGESRIEAAPARVRARGAERSVSWARRSGAQARNTEDTTRLSG